MVSRPISESSGEEAVLKGGIRRIGYGGEISREGARQTDVCL